MNKQNRFGNIQLGKRERSEERQTEHGWYNLDPYDTVLTRPAVVIFGGNTTDNPEFANGYAKIIESFLLEKYRKNYEIFSFYYKTESIDNVSKGLNKDYYDEIHEIFESMFKPMIYDKITGKMKELQGIEKAFRSLILVGHCGGCNFISEIIDDFYFELINKYSPATAEMLIKKIQYMGYAPNKFPSLKTNSLFIAPFRDSNFSWANVVSRIEEDKPDNDYPRNIHKEFKKLAYKYHPGDSFENYFLENRALVFKKDGEICIIPDSLNTIGGTDDHSIKVISKINNENDNALNAEIVSTAAKIFLNQAASSIPVDTKSTFLKIAQLIDNNPPAKEKC